LLSYHDPASELSRINREAAVHAVRVSRDTWNVLQAARRFSAASDGLFDASIAPTLAGLGYLPRHPDQPRASRHADWRHIELLPGRRVRLARPLRIDLGGIAKGYAVDCATGILRRHGIEHGGINAGGDLRRLDTAPYTLHLRRPDRPCAFVPVTSRLPAAATSADYFARRRRRGRPITPLINAVTRRACPGGRSVTVMAADCMTADALTKVLYADPATGRALLPAFGAEAVILDCDAADAVRAGVRLRQPLPGTARV